MSQMTADASITVYLECDRSVRSIVCESRFLLSNAPSHQGVAESFHHEPCKICLSHVQSRRCKTDILQYELGEIEIGGTPPRKLTSLPPCLLTCSTERTFLTFCSWNSSDATWRMGRDSESQILDLIIKRATDDQDVPGYCQ